MGALRILIADDHPGIRRSLRSLVLSHMEWDVCGEAEDGPEEVQKAEQLRPDVILLDVTMPGMSGIEVASRIHQKIPQTQILMVSQHDSPHLARLAAEVGAQDYIPKSEIWSALLPAIESADRERTRRRSWGTMR